MTSVASVEEPITWAHDPENGWSHEAGEWHSNIADALWVGTGESEMGTKSWRVVRSFGTIVAAIVGLTGCGSSGPEKAEISAADHADALTTAAGDNLFILTVTKAPGAYVLAAISVTAGLPGQTATVVNFTHGDLDGDGKLDQGETLSCKEPIANLFDASTVAQAVNVSIAEKENGTFFQIASTTWTATN